MRMVQFPLPSLPPVADEDQQLNIIQVKKIISLFFGYHQVTYHMVSGWFDLDDNCFQVWCTLPSTPNPGALLLPPTSSPSSAMHNFGESVKSTVFGYNILK
jgi:hypothetical protein